MNEKSYGIHRSLQISENSNSVRHDEQDDKIVSLSTDLADYSMGCRMPTVDIPHKPATKDKFSGPDYVFGENVETPCQQDFKNRGEYEGSPNHNKPYIFDSEREDCAILFRGVNSLRDSKNNTDESAGIRKQQTGSRNESENDVNIVFKYSNQERICELQSSLGQLLRIGTLEGSTWTEKNSKTLWTPCHLVLPNDQPEKSDKHDSSLCQVSGSEIIDSSCKNPLIKVEKIINESDCFRVATSLDLDLHSESPHGDVVRYVKEDLTCYIEEVKLYGFDHIIIIGERYCGMLFLDCYGRVFDLDTMMNILWFFGDYFERLSKKSKADRIAWDVLDDGTVFELEKYLPGKCNTNPIVEKKKKKKRH
ncbi:hypothetical protein Glove_319g20 [Diversispora epigaea]|uniref:Uncharacterized protein n=1 Tax=Diversispora epigaea TaxID=1348612 RepID=A0A397HVD4_9GLOM|nr:hypothetical protein Glove_319g20 [Diversispora epigaea]